MEQLKSKRYLAAAGLILLFLGTVLPYYQYSFFGYSIKICLYKYLEGDIVIALIVANLLFIFKDFVEKYVPQMFNSNIGKKIKDANPKMAVVPTILIAVFVIILFLRIDIGTTLKHGIGFYALWLGLISLIAHSFIYKGNNDGNSINQPTSSNVTIIDNQNQQDVNVINQQSLNNNTNYMNNGQTSAENVKYCTECGNKCEANANNCSACGRPF